MKFSKLGIVSIFLFLFSATGMAQTAADVPRPAPPALVSEMTEDGWRLPFAHPDPNPWHLIQEGFTRDDALAAQKRLAVILAEQAEGKSLPFTPMYRAWWDTREARMWVAPDAGYVFVYLHNCAHGVQALSYGDVQITEGRIELIPRGGNPLTLEPGSESFNPLGVIGRTIVRVRAGASEIIVPEERLTEFVEEASGRKVREEGIEVFYPFMNGTSTTGGGVVTKGRFPILPAEYSHLTRTPIRGRVVSVGTPVFHPEQEEETTNEKGEIERSTMSEHFVVPVTCEVDAPGEMVPGMWLRLCVADTMEVIQIVSVSGKTVTAEFDPFLMDTPEGWEKRSVAERIQWLNANQPFKVGLPVSTSKFDIPAEEADPGPSAAPK